MSTCQIWLLVMEGFLIQLHFLGIFHILLHVWNTITLSKFYKLCVKVEVKRDEKLSYLIIYDYVSLINKTDTMIQIENFFCLSCRSFTSQIKKKLLNWTTVTYHILDSLSLQTYQLVMNEKPTRYFLLNVNIRNFKMEILTWIFTCFFADSDSPIIGTNNSKYGTVTVFI